MSSQQQQQQDSQKKSPMQGSSSAGASEENLMDRFARGASRDSSLQYKNQHILPASSLVHPPGKNPPMAKPKALSEEEFARQQELQRKMLEEQRVKAKDQSFIMTRARGSSGGLPPKQYDMNQYKDWDHDTFLKALYDDPDLAQYVSEQAAKQQQEKAKMKRSMNSGSSSKRESKYRRPTKSKVEKEAEFLEELKKGGVPVMQWSVLIVIMTAVVYYLYKVLAGPQKSTTSKKKTVVRSKKQLGGKGRSRGLSASTNSKNVVEEKVVAELVEETVVDKQAATKKKAVSKKTSVRSSSSNKPTNTKQSKSSGNNSSAKQAPAKVAEHASLKPKENGSSTLPASAWQETKEDEGEWQTVRKRSDSVAKVTPAVQEVKPAAQTETPTNGAASDKKKQAKKTADVAPVEPDPVLAAPVESETKEEAVEPAAVAPAKEEAVMVNESKENSAPAPAPASTKKKKKKTKNSSTNPPQNGSSVPSPTAPVSPSVTKDDAMLAQSLQNEEEMAASSNPKKKPATVVEEDVWEEVTVRRRARNPSSKEQGDTEVADS